MPYVHTISNIFEPEVDSKFHEGGHALCTYVGNPSDSIVEWNGKRCEPDDYRKVVEEHDEIIIADVPGFGLEGPALVWFIIQAIIVVASVSYSIYSSLAAKRALKRAGRGGEQLEDSRRFTGIQTTVGANVVIPVIFGEVRAGGHIIESFSKPQSSYLDKSQSPAGTVHQRTPLGSDRAATAIGSETLNTRIAWCWGPIESVSDFHIDENPIENLAGMTVQSQLGTNVHPPLGGFTDRRIPSEVSSLVTVAGGAKTQTTKALVDAIEVELSFEGGLYQVDGRGTLVVRLVVIKVEVAETGFAFSEIAQLHVRGHTQQPMDVWIRLPQDARAQYDVKITRITADTTDSAISDEFVWKTMTEERDGERTHPGIAQTGFLQMPQNQTAVPSNYTALVRGLNDIRIYSTTSTYTTGWTANPAWCFLRWLTDRDFGLGAFYNYEDNVNLQAFIYWAQANDAMTSDGIGGSEARCRIDWEMAKSRSVTDIVGVFSNAGDADIIEQGGVWTVVVHEDSPVKKLISPGSYTLDSLNTTILSSKETNPTLTGAFVDRNQDYKENSITAIDDEIDPVLQSIPPEEVIFRGVTRASQVKRSLMKSIQFSRIADEIVNVRVGLAAIDLGAGDVVKIASPTGAYGLNGGRIIDVDRTNHTTITIDQDIELLSAGSYELSVQMPTGVEVLAVQSPAVDETTNVIELSSASWSETPVPGLSYAIGAVALSTQKFRVMSRTLRDDYTSDLQLHKFEDGMFDVNLVMDPPIPHQFLPNPSKAPDNPTDVMVDGQLNLTYDAAAGSSYRQNVSVYFNWKPPKNSLTQPAGYQIYQRIKPESTTDNDIAPFTELAFVTGTNWRWEVWAPQDTVVTYEVKIVSVSASGRTSTGTNVTEYQISNLDGWTSDT